MSTVNRNVIRIAIAMLLAGSCIRASDIFSGVNTGFVNPMTTLGDMIYGGASGTPTRLAGNTTSTLEILTSTGSGGSATAPAWTAASTIGFVNPMTSPGDMICGGVSGAATRFAATATAGLALLSGSNVCPSWSASAPALVGAANVFTANQTMPSIVLPGTTATNSAPLGSELTTSGTCSGTGWTGTYPNYVAPGTTAPLTCTGFTSGQSYQTVTSIGAGGSGAVTIAIGTAQTASGSSGTVTAGLKANGTSLTYTPVSTYTGTIGISAKLITPISQYTVTGKDSTGAVSIQVLQQTLATSHNNFGDSSGTYCTTCINNTSSGFEGQFSLTTGSYNTSSGFEGQYSLTTGINNTNSGYAGQYYLTTGNYDTNSGYAGQFSLTTGSSNTNGGYEGQYNLTTGSYNTNSGFEGQLSLTTGSYNTNSGYDGQYNLTTGSYNGSLGYQAGRYITGGSSPNQTSSYSLYLGVNTMAQANGDTNEIVIGGDSTSGATGAGSNTGVFGTPRMTDEYVGGSGAAAKVHASGFVGAGTSPTITGCGTISSQLGGALSGTFVSSATSCTPVLTSLPASTNGYQCFIVNETAGTGTVVGSISSTATSATFPTFTIVATNVLGFNCGVSF